MKKNHRDFKISVILTFVLLLLFSLLENVTPFSTTILLHHHGSTRSYISRRGDNRAAVHSTTTTTQLLAKKNAAAKKKKHKPSTSGFGGAATEICPCGSQETYMKCCGKLHKNIAQFAKATPEQIVRARYTAYAKREIDFIIQSTHPQNKNFQADIKHWRSQIDMNCYDNFELTKCEILEHEILDDKKTATVTFVANMIQRDSREKTAFMEKSIFEKVGGVWLYKEGEIGDPPGREANNEAAAAAAAKEESDEQEEDASAEATTTTIA